MADTVDVQTFALTRLEKVLSGAGATALLAKELESRGVERVLISTTGSLVGSPSLTTLVERLSPLVTVICGASRQHAPYEAVREIAAAIAESGAQAVISFGGGSVIDATKLAVVSHLDGRDMTLHGGELDLDLAFAAADLKSFLHISVPTTLSAGAFTPAGGTTDTINGVKHGVADPRMQPAVVVHDPQMTEDTPDWLWVATGVRALDHAIEALYSRRHHPLSDALAKEAIRLLVTHLPLSLKTDTRRAANRLICLDAAWMSLFGGFNTGLGLSHALGHQIGPAWNIPHGITSCITLAPAMRFVGERVPERFAPIAQALGIPQSDDARRTAHACADAIGDLVSSLGMPTLLKDFGVAHEELAKIAHATSSELTKFNSMDEPVDAAQILGILETCHGGPGGFDFIGWEGIHASDNGGRQGLAI